jgi:hypothetical protein
MGGMATWEDGPEYAPIERPDGFAQPPVSPLENPPPFEQMAALAPKDRPAFTDPPAPVAPLESLVPPVESPRDPAIPFAVVSSTVTNASAWGAAHWSPPTGPPAGTWAPPGTNGSAAAAPPAGGSPWPPPTEPLVPLSGPPQNVSGFPAPGTAGWFAPAPYGQQPPARAVDFSQVSAAATPGVLICLLVGGFFYLISPIMLGVAFALSGRVKAATTTVRRALLISVVVLGVLALVGALTIDTGFGDWWAFVGGCALIICWLMLGAVLLLVYRGLKSPGGPQQYRSPWG